MFIGSGRRKNSRRKSYGVCDDDFCIYGNSGNNCIGDCRDNQHNWAVSLIRRHRAKVRGEKPKKFGLIAGWILFLVPIVVIAGFIIYWFI